MAEDSTNVQAYMEGLSRLDRVIGDSGYAFTALDVVVRSGANSPVKLVLGKELVSLELIKNYPHLLFVNLAQNQIGDTTPLAELQYLVCANLSENAIAAPFALPQAYLTSKLEHLDLVPKPLCLILDCRYPLQSRSARALTPAGQFHAAREQDLESGRDRESLGTEFTGAAAKQHRDAGAATEGE